MEDKRLPPGQRKAVDVPLRHIGDIPQVSVETWRLEVYGEVETPKVFSFDDLGRMPKVVVVSDFHCVEGWSLLDSKWEGTPFKAIVDVVKPKATAKYVSFECYDGYTTSLPLSEVLKENVILAYKLNDKPLPLERGGPVRLVVPHKYAYKSPMWLRKAKFSSARELGYWEKRGYSDTADPWKEERRAE